MNAKKYICTYVGHTNWVRCARFSTDGQQIASCADDKSTKLFDVISRNCIHTFVETKGSGTTLSWHPNDHLIAVGLNSNRVKVYDTRTRTLVQLYDVCAGPVTSLSFHPSGDYLLIGSRDGESTVVDLVEGRPIYKIRGHNGSIEAVAFAKDGHRLATGGVDRQVKIVSAKKALTIIFRFMTGFYFLKFIYSCDLILFILEPDSLFYTLQCISN